MQAVRLQPFSLLHVTAFGPTPLSSSRFPPNGFVIVVQSISHVDLSAFFRSPKWLFHGYINMLEAWKEQTFFSSSLPSQRVSHSLKSEPLNSLAV
jgi:hypothetical protein